MADFSHLKKSGHSCVGCGKEGDKAPLTKLATYALAYACWACFKRYWDCGDCQHGPHPFGRVCKTCGCKNYRHSLAKEFDRQYEAGVGVTPRVKECQGYGQNMGKCGRAILADSAGTVSRLCHECEARWTREALEGHREINKAIIQGEEPDRVLH